MSSMSEANLEKKFQTVSNTQDSIQSLSLWILHHKAHSNKIVSVWMKVLKKAKIGHRLTLFYLANDVIQNGRRKGATQFVLAFSDVLKEAILLLKDDKIKGSIERVLRIWEDRNVYSAETISDFLDILRSSSERKKFKHEACNIFSQESSGLLKDRSSAKICKDSTAKILAEFKPENVTSYVKKIQKVEQDLVTKLAALNGSKLDAATSEVLSQLKDRSHGQQFSKDFDDATRCLEEYIKMLEREIKIRQDFIEVLEEAEIYHDTQRGEARVVANAYKNFAARVKTQKKKLEETSGKLPSPVPSPCEDAPSPSNSEGLELSPILGAPEASPPSPVGTPDGLKMSPVATTIAVTDKDPSVAGALNSFLPQAPGMMTSWLGSFTTAVAPTSQASSLDSRLLNFMQNLPGTPSKSETAIAKTTSILSEPKTTVMMGGDSGGGTPVKDEHSGQETPVQDEDTSPQQMLSKLISITMGNKDSSEHLKKFSPMGDRDERIADHRQFPEANDSVYSTDLNLLSDKDWRVPSASQTFLPKGTWSSSKDQNTTSTSFAVKSKPFSLPYDAIKTEGKGILSPFHTPDAAFSDNVVGTPPWNTSSSYQTTDGFKKLTEVDGIRRDDHFDKPLQPPPKPSFPGFDIFNSPPFSSMSTKDTEPQFTSKNSSVHSAPKSRQDPRLNSHNYANAPKGASNDGRVREHGKQEGDDIEPMDMDLEDSDTEQEHCDADPINASNQNKTVLININVSEASPLPTKRTEEFGSQILRSNGPQEDSIVRSVSPSDAPREMNSTPIKSLGDRNIAPMRSKDQSDYLANIDSMPKNSASEHSSRTDTGTARNRSSSHSDFATDDDRDSTRFSEHTDYVPDMENPPDEQLDYADKSALEPLRGDDQMDYSAEKPISNPGSTMHTSDFSPEANLSSPPYHDRHMPVGHDNREALPGGPSQGFPMESEEPWRIGPPWPVREPPWRGPRPRFEDNGYPRNDYGFDRRGGPGFQHFGPPPPLPPIPPMKRFPPPMHYFGRERRGFFRPHYH